MILFPNAKINIGLSVTGKRTDGYHNLETLFYPLTLCDILEFCVSADHLRFGSSGIACDEDMENNLVMKAYRILQKDYKLPALHIHLHKHIPIGSGLGGGSADAAFMLRGLNSYFSLNISDEQLQDYAIQLGSDCPFFIKNRACFAYGRGEKLEDVAFSIEKYSLLLVCPSVHISTKEAYAGITPKVPQIPIHEIIGKPVNTWRHILKNDFEAPVFAQYPEIEKIKHTMYELGALFSLMSGSGSSVYGIFEKLPADPKKYFPDMFVWYQ